MTPLNSLARAEAIALAGEAESQDTQLIMAKYHTEYGIGLTSSSPVPEERPQSRALKPQLPLQHEPGNRRRVTQTYVGKPQKRFGHLKNAPQHATQHALATTAAEALQQLHPELPESEILSKTGTGKFVKSSPVFDANHATTSAADPEIPEAPVESPNPLVKSDILPPLPPSSLSLQRGMDPSQSPTQPNDGRSYDQYGKSSLNEEDTSIVDFGLGSGPYGTQSSEPDDSGRVDLFRPLHPVSQNNSDSLHGQTPKTPAPPRNPFGNSKSGILGGSQLFKQTQPSSAFHRVSPTSSRPSPNDFPENSISPNPIISSPTKVAGRRSSLHIVETSSPQLLPDTSSSHRQNVVDTPYNDGSTDAVTLHSESPHKDYARKTYPSGPMAEYESMWESQKRREAARNHSTEEDSDDDFEDDELSRKWQKQRERNEISRHGMSAVLTLPSASDDVEVPSTGRRGNKVRPPAQEYIVQCHGRDPEEDSQDQETVADSQEQVAKAPPNDFYDIPKSLPNEDNDSSEPPLRKVSSAAPIETIPSKRRSSSMPSTQNDEYTGEAIPETSPPDEDPLPTASNGINAQLPSNSTKVLSGRSCPPQASGLQRGDAQNDPTIPETSDAVEEPVQDSESHIAALPTQVNEKQTSSPSLPEMKPPPRPEEQSPLPSSPPAHSTRARKKGQSDRVTGKSSSIAPRSSLPGHPTSSLSILSTSPNLSNKTTPGTDEFDLHDEVPDTTDNNHSSPAVSKVRRRQALQPLPKLKTAPREVKVTSRGNRQQVPSSADELTRSPLSVPTFEHSLRLPRTAISRPGRTLARVQSIAREESVRGGKIFEGMAFAISFQSHQPTHPSKSKKSGKNAKQARGPKEDLETIEKKIQQAGGRLLVNGFDELFGKPAVKSPLTSPSPSPQSDSDITILPTCSSTGFTALIADGHSRKVKYMQALALGLPCIATRWVTTCVEQGSLVDWTPYLLCAGQSSFLGDAIRSRNLASYNAADAKLVDVFEQRPRFLEGSNVLLVMTKAQEGDKMAYVFLARVLGASLSRVYTVEEARKKMRDMEDLGRPYDWVYIHEKADTGRLFNAKPPEPKKRKRASEGAEAGPPPKRIRTLSDELVIQSLILGRLIEEGEMEE